ncbi:MAG: glycoside hydrolase family 38 C-terminal domain-containing protein [Eubacteriales bacterium]|nr:glycoside hydrolase family 38 C-terminal domain-containing protein [Eubacteriales bacterium]
MALPKILDQRLTEVIQELQDFGRIRNFKYHIGNVDETDITASSYDDSAWDEYSGDVRFDRHQGMTWLRGTYTVPAFCRDIPLAASSLRIAAGVQIGAHYSAPITMYADGKKLLSEPVWMDCKVPEIILSESAQPGQIHRIAVYIDCGEKCYWEPSVPLLIISEAVERCYMELESIREELQYMESFAAATDLLPQAYAMLDEALAQEKILPIMKTIESCRALFEPLREEVKKNQVYLISHAHIDMNWFWPMEETKKVIDRDFTTMTKLMEENEDFVFSQSQCVTYAIEESQNPEVFKKMQYFVEKGQWDITATTWVENDMNMVSSESMEKQILYSKKYIKEKFGKDPLVMWAPDTYGFPGNLPQVFRKTGIKYLFHGRCGVGEESDLPYGDFDDFLRDAKHVPLYWWEGQDGSRILCSNNVYSRELSTRGVVRISRAMRERYSYNRAMYVFGVGDHGGGPTRRDIAWMRRIREFPTVPSLVFASTEEFFEQVEKDNPQSLPVRKGEINFTFAGGYTTGGLIKKINRTLETSLRRAEFLSAAAWLKGLAYPGEDLERLWRTTLFNQFHDTLNGSSVREVYDYLDSLYQKSIAEIAEIENHAALFLTESIKEGTDRAHRTYLVYNPTDSFREDCVLIPGQGACRAFSDTGKELLTQSTPEGILVKTDGIEPFGIHRIEIVSAETGDAAGEVSKISENEEYYLIHTGFYFAEIHKESGRITTLFDKRVNRYVVRRGCLGWRLDQGYLNTLQIHMEEPIGMFAWMMGCVNNIQSLTRGASSEIVEDGAIRKRIRFTHHYHSSEIVQDMILYTESPRIDFKTHVDWHETGDYDRDAPMLRVSFSPQVKNQYAVYETPFGIQKRLTGDYECPSLKFADISEEEYGFAILNNGKHGHRCMGNLIELALIRSSWEPDPESDTGEHDFIYSILPHEGGFQTGRVREEAELVNYPLQAIEVTGTECPFSKGLLTADNSDIEISGIKVSEDGEDIILKAHNVSESNAEAVFHTGFGVLKVQECDLLEQPGNSIENIENNRFQVTFGASEIKCFRVKPDKK